MSAVTFSPRYSISLRSPCDAALSAAEIPRYSEFISNQGKNVNVVRWPRAKPIRAPIAAVTAPSSSASLSAYDLANRR